MTSIHRWRRLPQRRANARASGMAVALVLGESQRPPTGMGPLRPLGRGSDPQDGDPRSVDGGEGERPDSICRCAVLTIERCTQMTDSGYPDLIIGGHLWTFVSTGGNLACCR